MRKHKAPPSGHPISPNPMPRTMQIGHSDISAASASITAAPAAATTSAATLEMEQQRMLLGHAAIDVNTPATAAATAKTAAATTSTTSRLAAPTAAAATLTAASSKERPRYRVQLMSLLHIASYVLCLCAFSFALYANVRQTRIEQRLQRLQHLDARIVELELRLEQQQLMHWPAEQVHIIESSSSPGDSANNENGSSPHLALHVRRELHRLRRDVSHLQLTRRQQRRQAAEAAAAAAAANLSGSLAANGECQCQPDNVTKQSEMLSILS
ncbi:GH20208 [Drosophila grimshawi]|uniref:GH20208 n=1 Tax=Drosophila grimshawi TaxID=7222 RepID=B4JRE1_DROGR|nr:GH20208 [Drosophila grimshawi]